MKIEFPNIGTGTMRTAGSYAALLISTEEDHGDRIDIVNSIIDALGISIAELEHYRKRPDVTHKNERDEWEREAERLKDMASMPDDPTEAP